MIPDKPHDVKWTNEQWCAIHASGTNILVSAGAGSGKTAVLTERVIEMIKKGISITNILVLTFTNAAAFEMKERIRKRLKVEAKTNTYCQENIVLLDQAMITTFDSYSLALVKKYHQVLGINQDVNIGDSILFTKKKQEIIHTVLEQAYNQANPNFLSLLDAFTMKDDTKIEQVLLYFGNSLDQLPDVDGYLETYLNRHYSLDVIAEHLQQYERHLSIQKEIIGSYLDALKPIIDEGLNNWFESLTVLLSPLKECHIYDEYHLVVETVRFPSLPRNLDPLIKEAINQLYGPLKEAWHSLKELLSYSSSQKMIGEVLATKEHMRIVIALLSDYWSSLTRYKREVNQYEFGDIARLAIQLVKEHPTIGSEIKNQTVEIMVDEYQDTNDIQETFLSYIANNNLYMVGDIKQSIYGFRNANPTIFQYKYDCYKQERGGIVIDLNQNFRSRTEVIDPVNQIFSSLMDHTVGGANYKDDHQLKVGFPDYQIDKQYQFEILDYPYQQTELKLHHTKEKIEATIIACHIEQLIKSAFKVFDPTTGNTRPIMYRDITILMDRKTSFEQYRAIFHDAHIPITIHKEVAFALSEEVYVIKNILVLVEGITNQEYRQRWPHAFLSVGRSFLYCYSDEQLFDVFLQAKEKNTSLYQILKQDPIWKTFYQTIECLSDHMKQSSLSTGIKQLYQIFNLYQRINQLNQVVRRSKTLDYILDLARQLEQKGMHVIELIEYLEVAIQGKVELAGNNSFKESDAVQLMSIHKSKGLEFPICYYAGLYKSFSKEDIKDRFVFSATLGFIIPTVAEGNKETFYKTLFKLDHQHHDVAERLRLWYVALTRAKEKMIIIANMQDQPTYESKQSVIPSFERFKCSSFLDFLSLVRIPFSSQIKSINEEELSFYPSLLKTATNWDQIAKPTDQIIKLKEVKKKEGNNPTIPFHVSMGMLSTSEKEYVKLGTKIHRYLEYFDFCNPLDSIKQLQIPAEEAIYIQKLLKQPFLKEIKKAKIYQEYAFIMGDQKGVIDLLLEYKDHFVIVDYKLKNINKEGYHRQVKSYINYIRSITDKPVRGYLYSLLEGAVVEVVEEKQLTL